MSAIVELVQKPEERKLIEFLEWDMGRELTQQEVNLALRQACEIGDL